VVSTIKYVREYECWCGELKRVTFRFISAGMYDGKKESFCPEQADLDLLECVS
jgi:hypothetical protein